MRIAVVVNCHVGLEAGDSRGFDHPSYLDDFEASATLPATARSLSEASVPEGDSLTCYVFGLAIDGSTGRDGEIREALERAMAPTGLRYEILTNLDVERMARAAPAEQRRFFSVAGYPEIRNLGFIVPVRRGDDVIVQIDDDEIVPRGYFAATRALLEAHPDKALFTAPYEKNGTIRIRTADDLRSWPKFSSMDRDMERLERSSGPVQTLFGFGGNMIARASFARKVFYPLGVPRGEDFSMLLAARLAFAAGGGTDAGLVAWFVNDRDLTVDHRPPAEAKKDFLAYLERNLRRFMLEWLMIHSQSAFDPAELGSLSYYQEAMLGVGDYRQETRRIYAELREQASRGERGPIGVAAVDASEARALAFFDASRSEPPRFPEYERLRKLWIAMLAS
ncbi:MAG: hypothetical protein KKA67_15655 [Spirochaetes bacterium]|nr:hypothetical protein [Spirochaetota bacterium]MBU1081510.1 hypothetical protein [Spirochaetota bacterium]